MARTRTEEDATEKALAAIQSALHVRDDERHSEGGRATPRSAEATSDLHFRTHGEYSKPGSIFVWEPESSIVSSAHKIADGWVQLIFFQLAIVAGAIAASGLRIDEYWRVLLIALGTLCLGFGIGAILYRRSREERVRNLQRDFKTLHARADALVHKSEELESRQGGR